ncbi:hypothetical protein NEMBOFW57_009978 [Staphylotrichum longicolle]|uniref:Cytochrome P450 n=1 Tax=Staphylotrichum longicolle TaxID=669026 RepID=A0AAD4EQD5_9PEZI|nr:hypothetical protein NEMBOFW57_009978 [Staphylotrichum longicolle]
MLILAVPICLVAALVFHEWQAWRTREWVHEQRRVASFQYAGEPALQERLHLRATENRRLKAAFGLDNSLTTKNPSAHKAFLATASRILNGNRSWEQLYAVAEGFLKGELEIAAENSKSTLRLAESVRCMVLAVVLFDSFGVDPVATPRSHLVTITDEINKQWLQSKCHPDNVIPSQGLNETVASLSITSPEHTPLPPPQVLSILMPQYETLWRVVLLTFVTAYHHQPAACHDTIQRTAAVPSCLGNPALEKDALKLAKEGLRLYPSNKHLYRSRNPTPNSPTSPATSSPPAAADLSALHRHPSIWGRDALAFRPSRFDDGQLTALQHEAYIPFSVKPHKCPAAGNAFGERMVAVLVVALGRELGPGNGRADFGEGVVKGWRWGEEGGIEDGKG